MYNLSLANLTISLEPQQSKAFSLHMIKSFSGMLFFTIHMTVTMQNHFRIMSRNSTVTLHVAVCYTSNQVEEWQNVRSSEPIISFKSRIPLFLRYVLYRICFAFTCYSFLSICHKPSYCSKSKQMISSYVPVIF